MSVGVFVDIGVAIGVNVGVGGMGAVAVGERNSASTFTKVTSVRTIGKPTPDPTMRLVTTVKKMARKASLAVTARC